MAATDEQLIVEFQATGSSAALDELMTRHLGNVRNLAYRMVLCHATADDVTQDVFVKVMHHAASFRGEARFSTWLCRIAMNTAKEHLRKQHKAPSFKLSEGIASVAAHERPDQLAMNEELVSRIEQAMAQLSTKLRAALVLMAIERLSAGEAAAIEGCSTATMHWRVHQARKQLKQNLQRYMKS